jgi:enhancing lycopene biosynthesis protein 2
MAINVKDIAAKVAKAEKLDIVEAAKGVRGTLYVLATLTMKELDALMVRYQALAKRKAKK